MSFAKGDVLIEYGQAYEVVDLKIKENAAGEKEEYLIYQPLFRIDRHTSTRHTIPVSSLPLTNKRKPVTQEKISELLKDLAAAISNKSPINIKDAEVAFKDNKPSKIIKMLRALHLEKSNREDNLSSTKQSLYEKGIDYLSQEVAVVMDMTLDSAKERIAAQLALAH